MSNTQVFLAQEDDGLPPEDGELDDVLSLKLVDELDQVALMVLAKVLGAQVCQLILGLDVEDADLALLHQLLHEKIPQRDTFCARTTGAVASHVQRRRAVEVQRHAAEALVKAQLQHHVGAEQRLQYCQSYRSELCLHRGLCGQPLQSHLEADRGVGERHNI